MVHERGAAAKDQVKLFFGFEVDAPWPDSFPEGRLIEPAMRHLTFLYLGSQKIPDLNAIPTPRFKVGKVGTFSHCHFLPGKQENTVSWEISWLEETDPLDDYFEQLRAWCAESDIPLPEAKKKLPHVTIARKPFDKPAWKNSFTPLPCAVTDVHLFESLGFSKYRSLWKGTLLPPFTHLDHIADVAFTVRGESLEQLYHNALTALLFEYPKMISVIEKHSNITSLEEIVIALNRQVAIADSHYGVPFKAVSFSGDVIESAEGIFTWEMIIDV